MDISCVLNVFDMYVFFVNCSIMNTKQQNIDEFYTDLKMYLSKKN